MGFRPTHLGPGLQQDLGACENKIKRNTSPTIPGGNVGGEMMI